MSVREKQTHLVNITFAGPYERTREYVKCGYCLTAGSILVSKREMELIGQQFVYVCPNCKTRQIIEVRKTGEVELNEGN